jgi:hypothetical protein
VTSLGTRRDEGPDLTALIQCYGKIGAFLTAKLAKQRLIGINFIRIWHGGIASMRIGVNFAPVPHRIAGITDLIGLVVQVGIVVVVAVIVEIIVEDTFKYAHRKISYVSNFPVLGSMLAPSLRREKLFPR